MQPVRQTSESHVVEHVGCFEGLILLLLQGLRVGDGFPGCKGGVQANGQRCHHGLRVKQHSLPTTTSRYPKDNQMESVRP